MKRLKLLELLLLGSAATQTVAAYSHGSEPACSKVNSMSVLYNFDREERASSHANDEAVVHRPVLENVLNQLRTKAGRDFINNIHFSDVRGVDFDSKAELSLKDLQRIDAYDFTFEVRAGDAGVYKYAFAIGTDKTGKILRDVEIPNIASSPEKAVIQPCVDAVAVARRAKVLSGKQQIFVRLRFDREADIFVWDIYAYRNVPGLHSDHVLINANELTVIRKYDEHEAF